MAIGAMLISKLEQLRQELDKLPVMQKLERTTRVPKEYTVAGIAFVLLICLATGHGASFICNVAGFLYPTYQSFRAIETSNKKDTTQWLTYWLIYGALTIPETFSSLLAWIPFYYIFKLALLLWCCAPQTSGAYYLYEHVLKGMLVKSEAKIDAVLSSTKLNASDAPHTDTHSTATPASTNGHHPPALSAHQSASVYPKLD